MGHVHPPCCSRKNGLWQPLLAHRTARGSVRVGGIPSLRWLLSLQLLIVDGQELRHNPASVMDNIQKFLGVTPLFNYTQALR